MRRLITVVVMGAFLVGMLCSSALGLKEDPSKDKPWMEQMRGRPNGDEVGWADVESPGLLRGSICRSTRGNSPLNFVLPKIVSLWLVAKDQYQALLEIDRSEDTATTPPGGGASSQ